MAHYQVKIYPEGICDVHVVKTGKTVWRAYGNFMGKHLEVPGTSERAALQNWKNAADYEHRSS